MPTTLDKGDLIAWMNLFADDMVAQRAYLTDLDAAIGDADHGINMARGMTAVRDKLVAQPPTTLGELFKTVGMTLVSSVGGAAGPLYGTFFLRLGTRLGDAETVDAGALADALRAGRDGVLARGKAQPGDKTMVDALVPAVDAFDATQQVSGDVASAATAAAQASAVGRDATTPLIARKGRASYLGERSIGHLDPGAASTAALFADLAAALGGAR